MVNQQAETHVITDPRVLKAVSDPLRRSILGVFTEKPQTTKQVAAVLGVRTNKLYHHVDVLANAGLLQLVETRPKRGTTEKYYLAIAKRFVMDPGVLGEPAANAAEAVLAKKLRVVSKVVAGSKAGVQAPMFVLESSVRLTAEQMEEVQAKLVAVVNSFSEDNQNGPTYSFVAMAYPIQKGAA